MHWKPGAALEYSCLVLALFAFTACKSAGPAIPAPPAESAPLPEVVPAGRDASTIAQRWAADAFELENTAVRDAAVAHIYAALQSTDRTQVHAGLIACGALATVAVDKKLFRERVLPHLNAEEVDVRMAAMGALYALGRQPLDLERILLAVKGVQRDARHRFVYEIVMFSDGDLTGEAGEVVFDILAATDPRSVRLVLSRMEGTRVSPAIEKIVIDMSNSPDPESVSDAIYWLSAVGDKSEAVVDRLIAALLDPDYDNRAAAFWAFGFNIPPAAQPRVADAVLRLFEESSYPLERENALAALRLHGGERHAAAIESFAAGSAVDEDLRRNIRESAATIRRR